MSQTVSTESAPTESAASHVWYEWIFGLVSCAVLFGPMLVVHFYFTEPTKIEVDDAAETVGIAVILRAMLRRLFRSGGRSVMQTALGTVTRASSRALTRRVVRVGVKSVAMIVRPNREVDEQEAAEEETPQSKVLAIGLGYLGLAASLYGILALLNLTAANIAAGFVGHMSFVEAALLGASPLLAYALVLVVAGPKCQVEVHFRTSLEGLLLQGYFTGSGSFLPLATDTKFVGSNPARAKLAGISIGGLFALHMLCYAAAHTTGLFEFEYLSGMFLLYCFVFVFPISPLDGSYLWSYSRVLWLLVGAIVLASFMYTLPDSFNAIL